MILDVIMIVLENEKAEIQNTLDKSDLDIKIDYVCISENGDLGTADSLKVVHDKLTSDVLVVPCDFVTDASLKGLLDTFRKHNSTIAALLIQPQPSEVFVVPGPKSKHKPG